MRRLVLFVLLPVVAVAQPVETSAPGPNGGPLSPAAAVGVSVVVPIAAVSLGVLAGGTTSDVVAGALIVGGALVGPSAANLIQGAYRDALVGTGLRTLGSGLVAGAFATVFMNDGVTDTHSNVATGVALVGTALVLAGTGYDINTSARNAARAPVTLGVGSEAGAPVLGLRVGL